MFLYTATHVLLAILSFTQCDDIVDVDETNEDKVRDEYNDWELPCNPGYLARFTPAMKNAIKNCNEKNINAYPCYQYCFAVENGDYGVDEDQKEKNLMTMFDMTDPGAKNTLQRWTHSTATCNHGFKALNKTMPLNYKGDCKDYDELRACVSFRRQCTDPRFT